MRLFSAVAVFALQMVLTNTLGLQEFGKFAYAYSWMLVFLIPGKLGLDNAALRFVAEYQAQEQTALLAGFLRKSQQLALLAGVAAALALALVGGFLGAENVPFVLFVLAAGSIPLLSVTHLCDSSLIALGFVRLGITSQILTSFLVIVFCGIVSLYKIASLTATDAWIIHIGAIGITVSVLRYILRRCAWGDSTVEASVYDTRLWLEMALPMTAVHVLNYLQNQSGTILCGMLMDPEQVGLFSTIYRVTGAAMLGLTAIATIASPTIAVLKAQGQLEQLQSYLRNCAWASTGIMIAMGIPIVVFGKMILTAFGPEFVVAYVPMLVLLSGFCVDALCGCVAQTFYMTGGLRSCLVVYTIGVVLSIVLNGVLIRSHGLLGAAIATTLVRVFWNVVLVVLLYRRLGVWSTIGPIRKKAKEVVAPVS